MNKFLSIIREPPVWLMALSIILMLIFSSLSIVLLVIGYMGVLCYAAYALAAVFLGYSVYVIVRFLPKIKASIKNAIEKNAFAKKYVSSISFRTFVGAIISLIFNVGFALFNGIMGILSKSPWFGSLSLYYILLSVTYTSLILNGKGESYKPYRRIGILLLVLNSALSLSIAQMIFDNRTFEYAGLMIYAFAAYAFYKITVAIIQLFKSRKKDSAQIKASALINTVGGMVSILALQTALLSTFGSEVRDISLFNTLTGSFVSLSTYAICIFMIINGTKKIKTEKNNERK